MRCISLGQARLLQVCYIKASIVCIKYKGKLKQKTNKTKLKKKTLKNPKTIFRDSKKPKLKFKSKGNRYE